MTANSGRCLKATLCRERQVFSASLGSSGGFREIFRDPLKVGNRDPVPTSRADVNDGYRGKAQSAMRTFGVEQTTALHNVGAPRLEFGIVFLA
jgi:hypothetical protein